MAQLACGLKESGKRFPWVSKPWSVDDETGLPAGFDEVARQVLVVEWCHQSVLAHPAVATFLTHCGWNSSLEVLTAGVPIVALPNFGDQKTNAKFLVDCQRRSDSELMRSLSDRSRKRYVNIAMWKSRDGRGSGRERIVGPERHGIRGRHSEQVAGAKKDPDPNSTMDKTRVAGSQPRGSWQLTSQNLVSKV